MAERPDIRARAELIRVRGLVQGVGFRPTVWRLAHRYGLDGWVANDGHGVRIRVRGAPSAIDRFVGALADEAPPLARIDRVERDAAALLPDEPGFRIVASERGGVHTGAVPDAAACRACIDEVEDPRARRYRHPFANCTHCGPRLSLVESIPYDRASTTMRAFAMCRACAAEYADPADRRFHAQPIACPDCGPRAWLERPDGARIEPAACGAADAVEAAAALLGRGGIVAIKGIGGFQLACDACDDAAVARLRRGKRRERKPFALMARDAGVIGRHAALGDAERALLSGSAAPIVILDATGPDRLAAGVAPGVATLGFMLPYTPLHHLLLQRWQRPIVLTSGNLSDEPQCIANADARARLGGIADAFLMHDREIARRVDDSVARVVAGAPRVLRRARGYAPAPIALPAGFERTPRVLAYGGDLKNAFCLLGDGAATLSPHVGDLHDAATRADFERSLADLTRFADFVPQAVACDLHPGYASTQLAQARAAQAGLPLVGTQHHHAHVAACMADNGVALDAAPVLGIALDGTGHGTDGTSWGGEFLRADYTGCTRLALFRPIALPGGEAAIREPWRCTHAHLHACVGWPAFDARCGGLELHAFLAQKPRALLDAMIERGVNAPRASSCGRLFDAVAAAVGIAREQALYEGQAAVELEAAVDRAGLDDAGGYAFAVTRPADGGGLPMLDPSPMWHALLEDLRRGAARGTIAARFHAGLAGAIVHLATWLAQRESLRTVALTGGVFHNRILFERVAGALDAQGFTTLSHHRVPCGDGGLALGQAAIAAARLRRH